VYNNEDFDIVVIPHNPFKKIDIPEYVRKRKSIAVEHIRRIRDCETENGRIGFARDMFMIMFYLMGINVNDLFKISKIEYGRINYERSKTDKFGKVHALPLSARIEPEAYTLIDKYSPDGCFLSETKRKYSNYENFTKGINTGLKLLCEEMGIPKITTNWARHSWASIARNKAKISKADIDFCLGHVNNDYKMADIYIDIDYSVCDDANRAVLDILKQPPDTK
jgi:hypothetical protein